jgi:hypothetical protein
MPLPRVRFTVRRTMVAVAVAASAFYGLILWRQAAEYRAKADAYELRALEDSLNARAATSNAFDARREPTAAQTAERRSLERRADHERRLSHKYDRAARYPFLPVALDPPEPE